MLHYQVRVSREVEAEVEAFEIGKYPVTVAEYRRFVADDGYDVLRFWREGMTPEEFGYKEPEGWPEQLDHPTWPVVGVSWDEAMAYCAWIGGGVTLPKQQQWARASHGTEGREYPWEDQPPDESRANFGSRVNSSTPVGIYPRGVSEDGLCDLAGNVWEWCQDEHNRGLARAACGGSWYDSAWFVRSASRIWDIPEVRYDFLGFRLARGQD